MQTIESYGESDMCPTNRTVVESKYDDGLQTSENRPLCVTNIAPSGSRQYLAEAGQFDGRLTNTEGFSAAEAISWFETQFGGMTLRQQGQAARAEADQISTCRIQNVGSNALTPIRLVGLWSLDGRKRISK